MAEIKIYKNHKQINGMPVIILLAVGPPSSAKPHKLEHLRNINSPMASIDKMVYSNTLKAKVSLGTWKVSPYVVVLKVF